MQKKDVLVFFSFKKHKTGYTEQLFEMTAKRALDSENVQLHRGALKELIIEVRDGKMSVFETMTGRDLASFDAVYFSLWQKARQQALAAATYLKRQNKAFFTSEVAHILAGSKVGEFALMSDNDLPLPNTFMSSKHQTLARFKANPPIDYPVIIKAASGYGGKWNYLVNNYGELKAVYEAHPDEPFFVVQQFIQNDYDYRCLVLGGEVKLIIKRQRTGDTHLNNTSQGANAELIDPNSLSAQQLRDVKKAAALVGRTDLAGVDLLFNSETGQHYILEVNQTPQIETGAFVAEKIDAVMSYARQRADGKN